VHQAILHKDAEAANGGLRTIMEAVRADTGVVNVIAAVGWLVHDARKAMQDLGSLPARRPGAASWLERWRSLAAEGLEAHVNVVLAAAARGAVRGEYQHPVRLLNDAALQGAELLLELGRTEEAAVLLERGRLVALGAAMQVQSQDAAARRLGRFDLVERRVVLTNQLAALEEAVVSPDALGAGLRAPSRSRQETADTARRCRAELRMVTEEIRRVTRFESREVDIETLRLAADPAPLLYVFTTEESGHAVLLHKDQPAAHLIWARWLVDDTDAHPFEVVTSWRAARSLVGSETGDAAWRTQVDATVGWLRDTLAHPLERLLERIDDLVIIPSGAMAELPLHAVLSERDGGSPRIVRYGAAARVLSERSQAAASARWTSARPGLLAVAVPSAGHAPDAATLMTADGLANNALAAFATRRNRFLGGSDASLANVSAQLPHFGVVHFSCHGRAEVTDPLNGGLELADGRFTLREILNLTLPASRLAVVAACEGSLSGTAMADELDSFATGLAEVGFSGVIAGMWQVQERAAFHLLTRFYEEWAKKPGVEPARLLAEALYWLRTATVATIEAYPVPGERPVRRANTSPELLARLAYPDADSWAALAYYGV
jgi:CHAT domain-containing protein